MQTSDSAQSAWRYEVLSPYVDELVVAGINVSRGPKSDMRDAFGLADALRLGAITTPMFKAPARFALLRELSRVYTMITRDVVRTQCRIKALYRSRGVPTTMSVYGKPQRETWLSKLHAPSLASALLFVELDALREQKNQAQDELVGESHRHPIAKVLETCPGLSEIRVAQLVPVVVAPERFRTEQILTQGTKPNLAKLTLARKIAAGVLSMWKHQEAYDSERHRKKLALG